MRAAVLRSFGRLDYADVQDPSCGPAEVIIDVRCVQPSVTECMLIDGDDVAMHGVLAALIDAGPVQFGGHEFAGVISQTGKDVTGVSAGDRVTAVETLPCGQCMPCSRARSDYCTRPSVVGFSRPGAFAERLAVPESAVVRLPDEVSFSCGAAVQPLAGAVHAHADLNVAPGETMLVIGGGVMGLLAVAVARHGNAGLIAVSTRSQRKRDLALEFGADIVIDAAQDVAAICRDLTGGVGFDTVVETAGGSESAGLAGTATVDVAVDAARRGGRIAMVSVLPARAELPAGRMREKGLRLFHPRSGAGFYAATTSVFEHSLGLVSRGRVDLEKLVTHRLDGLESLSEALAITRDKSRYGAINPAQVSLA
jgi:threonine dehydrogenase-like Zn-dependent dehydrogenase